MAGAMVASEPVGFRVRWVGSGVEEVKVISGLSGRVNWRV